MRFKRAYALVAAAGLLFLHHASVLPAQTSPALPTATYVPYSTTAIGITGTIRTAPGTLFLAGHTIALAEGRSLTGKDLKNAAEVFSADLTANSVATLYKVRISPAVRFKAGNTFCGREPTTFILILQNGKDLELAGFSGSTTPDLTPAVLDNSTYLCGTYGYTRK